MDSKKIDFIKQRLDRLERENRWWKVLGVVAVAALGLVVLTGATKSEVADEIWAKRIVLVDEAGRVRIELDTTRDDNFPFFRLTDKGGHNRITLGMKPDESPGLNLYNKAGKRGATLAMLSDYSSILSFYDKDGIPTIVLTGEMDGSSGIVIATKGGKGLASLIVDSKGALGLDISDKDGERRIWFGLAADGSPLLKLFDKDGQERTVLGHTTLEMVRRYVNLAQAHVMTQHNRFSPLDRMNIRQVNRVASFQTKKRFTKGVRPGVR